jgi:hypothetical protein
MEVKGWRIKKRFQNRETGLNVKENRSAKSGKKRIICQIAAAQIQKIFGFPESTESSD